LNGLEAPLHEHPRYRTKSSIFRTSISRSRTANHIDHGSGIASLVVGATPKTATLTDKPGDSFRRIVEHI
jgi:hypothetical protein